MSGGEETSMVEDLGEETAGGSDPPEGTDPTVSTAVAPQVPAPLVFHPPEQSGTHPLVKAAIDAGPLDPATLRELMALQRDWEAGESEKAYVQAMVAMKQGLPSVINRDKKVEFSNKGGGVTSYTHTSLAAAVEVITPHLCSHGFSASFETSTLDRGHVEVTCVLTHRAGHSRSTSLKGPPETSGTKNSVQAVASTVTLLQRYTLLALLGIATKDHADPQPAKPDEPVEIDEDLEAFAKATSSEEFAKARDAVKRKWRSLSGQQIDSLTRAKNEAEQRIRELDGHE